MRLIDADALQKEYMHEHDGKRLMLIDVAPTIEPQRTGRWLPLQLSMVHPPYQCSCCFRNAPMVETGCLVNRHLEALLSDFCPNCGADMTEDEE